MAKTTPWPVYLPDPLAAAASGSAGSLAGAARPRDRGRLCSECFYRLFKVNARRGLLRRAIARRLRRCAACPSAPQDPCRHASVCTALRCSHWHPRQAPDHCPVQRAWRRRQHAAWRASLTRSTSCTALRPCGATWHPGWMSRTAWRPRRRPGPASSTRAHRGHATDGRTRRRQRRHPRQTQAHLLQRR